MIFPCWMMPLFPNDYDVPPTIYALLNSYVNYGKDDKTKIPDLANAGRPCIFDFDYPLTDKISKQDFETLILNHYMMRRIGFDTLTAFKIALNSKLHEVMPIYNKLFDALDGWDIFKDGEDITRLSRDDGTSSTTSNGSNTLKNTLTAESDGTSDRRYSKMPQNEISNVQNGTYMTDYNYDQSRENSTTSSDSTGTNNDVTNGQTSNQTIETIKRSPSDKLSIYKQFVENKMSIYTMLFKELDDLFYGLV